MFLRKKIKKLYWVYLLVCLGLMTSPAAFALDPMTNTALHLKNIVFGVGMLLGFILTLGAFFLAQAQTITWEKFVYVAFSFLGFAVIPFLVSIFHNSVN